MIRKVTEYINHYHMLQPHDAVAAGISGGADSVCLLFLLNKIREEIPFELFVVHVNHGIREEAGEDEAFVCDLCRRWEIPFFAVHEDVAALAKAQGISQEEAGRNLRYRSFEQILKQEASSQWQQGRGKIAVAHNKNDRAETMLFHLFRGTGISGLCSIMPVRESVIRPLLCVTREEIENFLEKERLSYCIDRTNGEDTYTRNKIRNHLFPYITEQISPAAIEKMNHTADLVSEARDYIRQETTKAYMRCIPVPHGDEGGIRIQVKAFREEADFLQGELLLRVLEEMVPGRKDITAAHVCAVRELFSAQGSKSVDLPYGLCAKKEYDVLTIFFKQTEKKDIDGKEISVEQIPGVYALPGMGELEFSFLKCEKSGEIPENRYTKWFDYDKISKSVVIRKRRSGDYLTINRELSRKSLKDYMIQEKIPKTIRDDIWIVAEGSHVLWVIGYRISSQYKIDETTKHILQVQLRGGAPWQST